MIAVAQHPQHREIERLGSSLLGYRDDWAAFCADKFGVRNDPWQRRVLWSIQENQKVATAGAQGVGKDFVAAEAAASKLILYPHSKVGVTSASRKTLRTNFWGELALLYKSSDLFQRFFEMDTQSVRARGHRETWCLIARTSSAHYSTGTGVGSGEKEAESIAGMYAKGGTLVIVDEASGVDDAVFDSLEGTANTSDCKLVYLGNPLRRSGRFHDVFRRPAFAAGWKHFHIDFTQSARTNTPEGRAIRLQWIRQHGRNSAFVQARVWGRFPTGGSIDTVLNEDLVAAAFARGSSPVWLRSNTGERAWAYPLDIGVDMARFGDDESVILVRSGPHALRMETMGKKDSTFVLGRILHWIRTYSGTPPGEPIADEVKAQVTIRVDEGGGYGSGAIDPLRKMGFRCAGVHNGASPRGRKGREQYDNLATQLWDEDLKTALATAHLSAIADDALLHQLVSRQYEYSVGRESKMRLVSKEKMRKAGLGSPDRADALVLAFADLRKLGMTNITSTIRLL